MPGRCGGAWCLWEERAGDGHRAPERGGAGRGVTLWPVARARVAGGAEGGNVGCEPAIHGSYILSLA